MPARIMIVDDEEYIRKALICLLEDHGEFHLRAVHSAEEALRELESEPADLCIVDLRLPGMSGEAFILTARELGRCPRHVLHTGSVEYTLSNNLGKIGMTEQDVLRKPCDSMRILERVRALLGPRAE